MTAGCGLTLDLEAAFETAPGCPPGIPVELRQILEAPPDTEIEAWIEDGSFRPATGSARDSVLCAGRVRFGAAAKPDPSCDLVIEDSGDRVAFSMSTTGLWHIAISGCAIGVNGRICGVWWTRVVTLPRRAG